MYVPDWDWVCGVKRLMNDLNVFGELNCKIQKIICKILQPFIRNTNKRNRVFNKIII